MSWEQVVLTAETPVQKDWETECQVAAAKPGASRNIRHKSSQPQNGYLSKEGKVGKVKKAIKHSVNVDSAEAQIGGMPEETTETMKVKKLPQT